MDPSESGAPRGEVRVGAGAIAAIVRRAAAGVPGVVAIGPQPGGLRVLVGPGGLEIEVALVIALGASIGGVAEAARAAIQAAMQRSLGQAPAALRVYVAGTRQL